MQFEFWTLKWKYLTQLDLEAEFLYINENKSLTLLLK